MKYKLWYLQAKKLDNTLCNETIAVNFSTSMENIENEYNVDLQEIINKYTKEKAWNVINTLVDLTNKDNKCKIGYISRVTLQVGNILFNEYFEEEKDLIKKLYNIYTNILH